MFFIKFDRGVVRGSHLQLYFLDPVVSHFAEKSDEKRGADVMSLLRFLHREHQDSCFVPCYPCSNEEPDERVMEVGDEEALRERFVELVEDRGVVPLRECVVGKLND